MHGEQIELWYFLLGAHRLTKVRKLIHADYLLYVAHTRLQEVAPTVLNLVVLKLRRIHLLGLLLLLPLDKERGERFSTARLHRRLRLFHFQVVYANFTRRFLVTTILQMLSFSRLRWPSAVACLTSLATLTRQGQSKNFIRFVIVRVIIGDCVALHGKTWHRWLNLRRFMSDLASYELLSHLA